MCDRVKSVRVEDVLTDSQVDHIVRRCVGDGRWQLVGCEIQPAFEGLGGFGADHFRLKIQVQVDGQLQNLPLFVKTAPLNNDAMLNFVEEFNLFTREMTVFKLIEEMETGQERWAPKALFYSKSVIVLPDLAYEGYSVRNQLETFDLPHLMVALATVARFHAASANHDTRKAVALQRPYSLMEDHGQVIVESTFRDTPWVRTGAKLTANIIRHLSKYRDSIHDLEAKVLRQFLAGFEDPAESEVSLNVVLHKDLWVNNIMFKYKGDAPVSTVLIDFQCARYGPPAFDVMMLLYLNTWRSFRQQHENSVLRHYFKIFMESLDVDTKLRLKGLGYDCEEFLRWVDVARRFGMVAGLMLFPSTLLDPVSASELFGDPETHDRVMYEDRTAAVMAHARRCPSYGRRQLDLTEEFVERCLQP